MPTRLIIKTIILTKKIKFILLIENFPNKLVKTEFLFSPISTFTSETKLINVGSKLNVIINIPAKKKRRKKKSIRLPFNNYVLDTESESDYEPESESEKGKLFTDGLHVEGEDSSEPAGAAEYPAKSLNGRFSILLNLSI